jgi:hypothetical protein
MTAVINNKVPAAHSTIDAVAEGWVRLGVMLNVTALETETPDVERLLLGTARHASRNTRLLIMGATWLARRGRCVAKHRLAQVIASELEVEHQAVMGFMLEWATTHADWGVGGHFKAAIRACRAAKDPGPLTEVERRVPAFARLAELRASALSRKWGRWLEDFEAKDDALRTAEWFREHHPALVARAMTGGDVAASVLAELASAGGRVASEAELASRCGVTRAAIRDALANLQSIGEVRTARHGRANVVEAAHPRNAA